MTEDHVILYRDVVDSPDTDMKKAGVQAYCACNWESSVYMFAQGVEDEIGNHLYEVWLSKREEPV